MYVQIVFNAELTPQLVKDKIEYLTKKKSNAIGIQLHQNCDNL